MNYRTSSMSQSIRTKFGLVTASILLTLLFVFYLGGRFILVHMIRQAEQEIQSLGSDIKSVIYGEISTLQSEAMRASTTMAQQRDRPIPDTLKEFLIPYAGKAPVNLTVALSETGSFLSGFFSAPGETSVPVSESQLTPYISPDSPLMVSVTQGKSVSGAITFSGKPLFIAFTPVTNATGQTQNYLIMGSIIGNSPLINRINEATRGMQVAVMTRRTPKPVLPHDQPTAKEEGVAPIFADALNFYSGGKWHLGDNTFEAVLPVHDIMGREVSSISIRLPRSFSSLASIALGWLTVFVATVGIVFVLPIFWLQTRIVLNPLTHLADQIRNIGEHHLDGHGTYIQWSNKDEFGLVAQSVNTMLDALSRKTQHICQIEQRQRALIAGMPDCLCVFDTDGNLVAVHKQPDYAHPIPGLIPGRPIQPPLFPANDCEALRKAITETFHTQKIQMVIISCRESDGSYRHFETRISLMDAFFALVILRDVTFEWREREARQQMESRLVKIQKMESLGNLAASIAHDFNNILAIIQNTLDLTWIQLRPTKEEESAITTIRQAMAKGSALTHELMTYAGQTRTVFKRDDPNALILELEKLMSGVVAANVSLDFKLTPGLPKVDADPHQFWKVIINLLKNASESMNGARGHISISTYAFTITEQNREEFISTQELLPGPGVMFQIDDTGSGIPREIIGRLFEPFFSTKAVGRGLGLATVFGIVGAHNGALAIESEPEKGSSFRIWLPAAKETSMDQVADTAARTLSDPATLDTDNPASSADRPATTATQTKPLKPRILMVEDDPAILQTTRILLQSLGAEAITAATQREALALFRKHADSINLILLDAQIGRLDNVRLLTTFRMRKSGIPTVIVSGHTETKIREMFAAAPFNGFLGKPYSLEDLRCALAPFIPLHRPDILR